MKKSCFDDFSASDIRDNINEWIRSQRDRDILTDALINGLSYYQLADKYSLSNTRIVKIVYSQGERLLQKMGK